MIFQGELQLALYARQLLPLSKKGFTDNLPLFIAEVKSYLYSKAHKPYKNTYRSLLLLVLLHQHIFMSIFKMRAKSSENSLKIQTLIKNIPVTKILSLKAEAFKTTMK